jgi:hypothetical protein
VEAIPVPMPIDHARTIAKALQVDPEHPGTLRLAQALALALDLPTQPRWSSARSPAQRRHSLNALDVVSSSRLRLTSIM